MNSRILFLQFWPYTSCFFSYDLLYSPLALLRFLFFFLSSHPLLSHLPMYPCDPLLPPFFRACQLIIQGKIYTRCVILESSCFLFFFSLEFDSDRCISDIIPPSISLPFPILIYLFQSWLVYLFSHSFHLQQTNQLPKKHSRFYHHFSHWNSLFLENKLVIICFIIYLSILTNDSRLFTLLHFFYLFLGYLVVVVYLQSIFVHDI